MRDLKDYSDQELWNLIRLDDQKAFDVIYERYVAKLMISAYNVLRDNEVCQDIIQDVFTDLWIKRKTTFINSLPAYLKTAVRNHVFKKLRRGYLTKAHLKNLEMVSFVDATEQMVNYHQLQELYEKSIETLPERCKEIFLLSRKSNLPVKAIAARLNISPKTVENQITKALNHLRMHMGELMTAFVLTFLV